MVRIDGSLVRQLREEKGLTQLYLATAVEVTTDTISRWENKHYQSVKKDNAQRLAAALEVELAAILEVDEKGKDPKVESKKAPRDQGPRLNLSALALALVSTLVVVLVLVIFSRHKRSVPEIPLLLEATRKAPRHAMPGYPFPVVITVETGATPLSVVIKESLPDQVQVSASSSTLRLIERPELKWIVKHMTGKQRFGYMMTNMGTETLPFHGTVTSRVGHKKELIIGGSPYLVMAPFHWADINKDSIISDDEILVVYDDFDDVDGLSVDVELVEEMWMGSGYRWSKAKGLFEVIP